MRIIADDKIPYLKGVFEPVCDIEYYPGKEINNSILKNADALITRTRTKCNAKLLEGTKVKFIATATIGFDHIDTQFCAQKGIRWTNAPGCNSSSVQQYIASAMVTLAKKYQFNIQDKTFGIVGIGNVGKKIVRLLDLMDCKVYLNDPPRARKEGPCGFVNLDSIIRECDIISFHVPLNMEGADKTFHLANQYLFNKLNKDTIIINSSRGEIVDTPAIKNAINTGIVKAAVLDVWENEPHIDKELLNKVDIATPHIAGYSADGKGNGTMMSVQAVSRFFNLGLDTWKPKDIPVPDNTLIDLNCQGKNLQDILTEVFITTYPILEDDNRLREEFSEFEKQRANYPLRREFTSYTIRITNDHNNYGKILEKFGFHTFIE